MSFLGSQTGVDHTHQSNYDNLEFVWPETNLI